jgi:enamine deaminase RidA (YjgF/YER057c/UK114 family)
VNQLGQIRADGNGKTAIISPKLALRKNNVPGLWMTSVEGLSHEEFHLTLQPLLGEKPKEMVQRLATVLQKKNATVVRHEIFGSVAAHKETIQILQREIPDFDWPMMWIENGKNTDSAISGMHVFAVAGTNVDTVRQEGEPIGRVFDDGQTRHCLLSGLKPANPSVSNPAQCREVFKNLEHALHEVDMNMTDVARTWFFLDNIRSWYREFNNARIEFFKERKLLDGLLPASTGIGGRNPGGVAIIGGAWAIQAAKSSVSITEAPSPLQCSSMEYGSAFSRAVLVDTPLCHRLLISGTASIGPDGRSLHVGDLRRQLALTMEVAREILASRGFNFSNVTRATTYFKNLQEVLVFNAWQREHSLEFLPLVAVPADICRQELLFEIELDAILLGKTNPTIFESVSSLTMEN